MVESLARDDLRIAGLAVAAEELDKDVPVGQDLELERRRCICGTWLLPLCQSFQFVGHQIDCLLFVTGQVGLLRLDFGHDVQMHPLDLLVGEYAGRRPPSVGSVLHSALLETFRDPFLVGQRYTGRSAEGIVNAAKLTSTSWVFPSNPASLNQFLQCLACRIPIAAHGIPQARHRPPCPRMCSWP